MDDDRVKKIPCVGSDLQAWRFVGSERQLNQVAELASSGTTIPSEITLTLRQFGFKREHRVQNLMIRRMTEFWRGYEVMATAVNNLEVCGEVKKTQKGEMNVSVWRHLRGSRLVMSGSTEDLG